MEGYFARKAFMSDLHPGVPHGHSPFEPRVAADPPPSVPLRVSADIRRVDAWALVLVSAGFRPLVRWAEGRFELHVMQGEVDAARLELDACDAEERERAVLAEPTRDERPATWRAHVAS